MGRPATGPLEPRPWKSPGGKEGTEEGERKREWSAFVEREAEKTGETKVWII